MDAVEEESSSWSFDEEALSSGFFVDEESEHAVLADERDLSINRPKHKQSVLAIGK